MMSRIYLKLIRYFVVLIITTCFASMVLFFLTVGYPMARDFHRLLRKHAQYIGHLTGDLIERGASSDEMNRFLKTSSDSYEAGIILFNQDLIMVAGSKGNETFDVAITGEMLQVIRESGLYVQPSHMGKPLIYILPVSSVKGSQYYLCIYKTFSRLKRSLFFSSGIVLLCFLLILAIYPLSKGFTRPLIQLTDGLKEMAAGNFDPTIDVGSRKDELGDLLRSFRDMSRSVETMIESRKVLLADISHELRSPLGRLSIAAELIKEVSHTSDISGYIDNIEYEINYMDKLLKQLSEYSTLNLPDIQMTIELFSALDIMRVVFKRYQPLMEKQGILFVLQPCKIESFISADRARITQVLNNLLDNAIHACGPQGEITLALSELEGKTNFSVINTGPEIPVHLREKIFDPLFRTDPSRSRKTGGLGLGLAISKKIIEHHEGTIICECEDGVTRFSFCLQTA